MADRIKMILDVDTGSDDAVAIMLATLHPAVQLLGITTVVGNKPIENTTDNTLRVVQLLGQGTPVYRGCSAPMVCNLLPGRRGGYTGMTGVTNDKRDKNGEVIAYHHDFLPIPPATIHEHPEHGVFWLIDTLMRSDGDIVLVPTGPLTNVAMAIRLEPRICQKIKRIVFMGGGFKVFNSTSAAEFNIWADPEAAQIVMTSGVPLTMVPLDATHRANLTLEQARDLRFHGSPVTVAVAALIEERVLAYNAYQPQALPDSAPLHDALAVAAAIDPLVLCNVQLMRVDVDFSGGFADGQTICDTRAFPDRKPNVDVALGADRDRFTDMLLPLLRTT